MASSWRVLATDEFESNLDEADEGECVVTLLRLFYMTSNWRKRILGEGSEG